MTVEKRDHPQQIGWRDRIEEYEDGYGSAADFERAGADQPGDENGDGSGDDGPDADQIKNICGQILAGYAQGKSGLDDGMIDLLIELGDLSSDIITLLNERTR